MTPRRRSPKLLVWIVTGVVYLVVAVLVWFLGSWLALRGGSLWIVRGGLWVLGLLAASLVLWFLAPRAREREADADLRDGEDVLAILAAAEARLRSAKQARARSLGNLPVIVVLGPAGSTKTTVIVNSGLEPDLLAGEVYQDGDRIGPTPAVNVWYTNRTVLLEAGGQLAQDPDRWRQLVRRLRPRRLAAMFTRRAQAARAAVVCFSCEDLQQAGALESVTASARDLRGQLLELAQGFGIQLPVYVLFTKADRISYFAEYAQPLARDEAQQVLGMTLRWPSRTSVGLYGEREFQRLNAAFERLLAALGAKRLDLLAREPDVARKAAAYEFPRELRKLIPTATQFLVDLCRPSQLDVSPVLRGVYLTGVRAVVVSDVAPASSRAAPSARGGGGATQVFDPAAIASVSEPVAAGTRKLPQWLFLGQFVRDVLLRDRAAAAVARGARRVSGLQRIWLVAAAVLALLIGVQSFVAYLNNADAVEAEHALSAAPASEAALPALETLQRLDGLRAHLERLSRASNWWPFYNGSTLYPQLVPVYRERLDRILLGPARVSLLHSLDSLPNAPNATAQFGRAYELLKAYLMATSHPEKLTADFIVPVLLEGWRNGQEVDAARTELARRQLDFYAARLCRASACATDADADIVGRTRAFLVKFTGADRVYQLVVSDVSGRVPGIQFARLFAGAGNTLMDSYDIPGAYTPAGWALMQDALQHVDRFFQADDWVLGQEQQAQVDRAKLADDLRTLYATDYVHRWQNFLAAASVAAFGSPKDAASKLAQLGGNESPLLELLSVVSRNTNVDSLTIGAAFQPVRVVIPATVTDRFVADANQPYVTALNGLQALVAQAADAPPGGADALVAQTLDAARGAKSAVAQLTLKFRVDGDAGAVGARVQALLNDPVDQVERLLGRLPATAMNDRGTAFCRALAPLLAKYPFRPDASVEATLDEVASVFEPNDGALWHFRDEALQTVLVKQGTQYVAKPGSTATPASAFVRFFNRLAAVTDALWPAGATEPRFEFTVKLLPSEAVPTATFTMDGQVSRFTRTYAAAQPYAWAGSTAREVRLTAELHGRDQPLLGFDGPWALFKLLQRATWRTTGPASLVQWPVTVEGQATALQAELNLGAARPILKGDYFSGFSCVSQIVQSR